MDVENEVVPSDPEHIKALMEPGPKGPIFMVNMLKFKDKAEYADGRETDLTGREAYGIYGRAVAKLLPKFGGKPFFMGDVTSLRSGRSRNCGTKLLSPLIQCARTWSVCRCHRNGRR